MSGLLQLLAALIVIMVFVPASIWAYEHEHVATFIVTLFVGCVALWIVIMFGAVALINAL